MRFCPRGGLRLALSGACLISGIGDVRTAVIDVTSSGVRSGYSSGMGSQIVTRRRLIQGGAALASLGLLAGCGVPLGPFAQPAGPRRIGFLVNAGPTSSPATLDHFRQGLAELGYVEGQDVALEVRYA